MSKNTLKLASYGASLSLALTLGLSAMAQDDTQKGSTNTAQTRNTTAMTVSNGQKMKIRGVVVDRQADMLTVKDAATGSTVPVKIAGETSIKSKKFFGSGKSYASELLTRGLYLEAQGRGDSSGTLVADKIRFGEDDLRNAQAIEARVNPVEGRVGAAEERVGAVEQNAQRLSGQLDELVAISNAARGGAKAAQDTADAAVSGVNATNTRITELDDYAVQSSAIVNFKVGSAVLSPEAKTQLDTVAQGSTSMKGFVMEVTGFADATGDTKRNRALSQRRAEAVIQYLVETHGVPLRRILPSYGFGELNSVADNKTREGRAQNRRVEVKLLVSKGLSNSVEVRNPNQQSTNNPTTPQQ
jgi:outer membrane protein OmpA-like peptidoglycan-associated protein